MDSFDDSLKYLIDHEPEAFIRFASGNPAAQVVESVPVALPSRSRAVDAAYRIVIDGVTMLAHVEFHRRHQSLEELAVDVAEAQVRFYRRERLPLVSIVWDLYGNGTSPAIENRVFQFSVWPGPSLSQCVYRRVNLRGISLHEFLEQASPCLWPLAPLTRDGATVEAVREVWARIEAFPGLSSSHRVDHLAILWFIAGAEDVPVQVLKEYLSKEKIMESVLYREFFQKWEAQGRILGEFRNKAETVVRILAARMDTLDPVVREKIYGQTIPEVLDLWYNDAVLAATAEDASRLAEKIRHAPMPEPGP